MSLEQLLAQIILALQDNNSLLRQLLCQGGALAASGDAKPVRKTHASKVEPAPPAAEVEPAPPAAKVAPAPPAAVTDDVTLDDVNAALSVKLAELGNRSQIDGVFVEMGYRGLRGLPPEQYSAFLGKIKTLKPKAAVIA